MSAMNVWTQDIMQKHGTEEKKIIILLRATC